MLRACWHFYSCDRPSGSLGTGLGTKCGKGSSALVGWMSARGCSFQWPAFKPFITMPLGIKRLSTYILSFQVCLKVLSVSLDPGSFFFFSFSCRVCQCLLAIILFTVNMHILGNNAWLCVFWLQPFLPFLHLSVPFT